MRKEIYSDRYNFLLLVAQMILQYHEIDYNDVLLSLNKIMMNYSNTGSSQDAPHFSAVVNLMLEAHYNALIISNRNRHFCDHNVHRGTVEI